MNSIDAQFEKVAREIQPSYEKAASDWSPPPGRYTVLLQDLYVGTQKNDKGEDFLVVSPTWKVLDGQYDQATFRGERRTSKSQGSLNILRGFIDKCLGEPSGNILDDVKALNGMVGSLVLEIELYEKAGNNGRVFKNEKIVSVLETAA